MEKIGGTRVGARDAYGRPFSPEKKIVVKRLERYQMLWTQKGIAIEQELKRLQSVMNLPRTCMEQALEIYKQAREQLDVRMPVEPLAAATLYMACRMLKMPRPLEEFERYTKTSSKKIGRYYRLLLGILNVKVPISDPVLYISRIAGQLKLSGEVVKTTVEILQKAKKAGVTSGKDPAGLAAAAVYIAALMYGETVTQKEIVATVDVATPTLRDKIRLLSKLISRLTLKGFKREVEVGGKKYVVKVINGEGRIEESQSGKPLLRIRITAEINGAIHEYEITFGRYGKDRTTRGISVADTDNAVALVKALTEKEPGIRRKGSGKIELVCGRQHLDALARYAELADVIEEWLSR
jgi:transcription initiation factor TFIIIB Brf1 subunit/transcription initiation factor TFIIB